MFALYPEMPRYYVMAIGEYLENGTAADTGCLTFGAFPDLFCKTNPIASASLYYDYTYNSLSFNLDSFGYGSQRVNGGTAKMDSGLPMILVPLEAFNLLFNAIQPDYDYELQLYTTDCSNAGVLDDLVFTIGNVDLNVPSTVYIIDLSLGDGRCVVKFSLSNDFTTPFALGMPFTDTFCVKWDIDNNTISMFNFVD
ncbi:Peptidase A1 domain-containing protein [Aphelenchoides besseyi]|nr:Peptidase A1 domain-containing protein [Aphelenchoides besseyi]